MKKLIYLLPVLIILILSGCATGKTAYLNSFNKFVENVKKDYPNYSKQDWQKADKKFLEYSGTDYRTYKNELTPAEKKEVGTLMGSYASIRVKSGIENFTLDLKDILNRATGILNGLDQ